MKNHIQISFSILLIFILLLVTHFAQSQIIVTQVTEMSQKPAGVGLFYTLPRTSVEIKIKIKKTEHIKGPYAYYAEELMGLTDFVTKDFNQFEVISADIETKAIPDPDRIFFVQLTDRSSKDPILSKFSFTKSGIILGMNINPEINRNNTAFFSDQNSDIYPELFSQNKSGKIRQKIDTIVRIVTTDTNVYKRLYYKTVFEVVANKEKAKKVVEDINKIRDNRNSLLSGYQEIAYDPQTLKYMIEELDKLTNEYISLFRGVKVESYEEYTFTVVPPKDDPTYSTPLCKFSAESGVQSIESGKGKNIVLNFLTEGDANLVTAFKSGSTNALSGGLYYGIPERAKVSINYYGQEIKSSFLLINQFGTTNQLSKKVEQVVFDPITGIATEVIY